MHSCIKLHSPLKIIFGKGGYIWQDGLPTGVSLYRDHYVLIAWKSMLLELISQNRFSESMPGESCGAENSRTLIILQAKVEMAWIIYNK